MKRNRTAYSVAWFEKNPRVEGSQTDQGEVLDDGCHMTSASRALRSKGHVIIINSIKFILKILYFCKRKLNFYNNLNLIIYYLNNIYIF